MNRDVWIQWQINFVNSLKKQSEKSGYSFDILDSQLSKEFPRSRKIYIAGMKRSGNHAIINWMIKNCFESQVFINNASTPTPDLIEVFNAEELHPRLVDRTVCSFEHLSFDFFSSSSTWYIARDPYNWLASWINHHHFDMDTIQKDVSTYISNIEKSENLILYNKWFSSQEYRNNIAHSLEFLNRDLGLDDISKYGRGSSFDSRDKFEGKGSSMDVLNRWKNEIENDLYRNIIDENKDSFRDISNKIFEMECPLD